MRRFTFPEALFGWTVILSASSGSLAGVTSHPPSVSPLARFAARTEVVRVDVGVVDEKGRPVQDLKVDDFVVEEGDVPQKIESIESITSSPDAPLEPWSGDRVSSNTGPPMHAGRAFVIVFDDVHLTSSGAKRARSAVVDFMKGLSANDQVGVVSTSGQIWCTGAAPRNREAVLAALQPLKGLRLQDPLGTDQMTEYEAMQIAQYDDAITLKNVEARWQREITRIARDGSSSMFSAEGGPAFDPLGSMGDQQSSLIDTGQGQDVPGGDVLAAQSMSRHLQARVRQETATAKDLATHLHARTRQRRGQVLQSLQRILTALTASEDRKAVILMSERFLYDETDPQFGATLDIARRANAAIYVVDVGGLVDSERQGAEQRAGDLGVGFGEQVEVRHGLARLASDGGGFANTGSNDPKGGLERIGRESTHYYLLAYRPKNDVFDAKYRRIRVAVNRPGVLVRARPGYSAVPNGPPEEDGEGHETSQRRLRQALDAPVSIPGIPLRMSSHMFDGTSDGMTRTLLVADLRTDELAFEEKEGRIVADVDVIVSARHFASGKTLAEQPVVARLTARPDAMGKNVWHSISRVVPLPAGPCQVRLVVRDRKSGIVGSVIHSLNVPAETQWRVSSPILSDIVKPSEDGAQQHALPVARRTFPAAGTLFCEFEVYHSAVDRLTGLPRVSQSLSLVSEDGKTERQLEPTPIIPTSDRRVAQLVTVPLRGLTPGNYSLVLKIRDEVAEQALELREPFSLARPSRPTPDIYRDLLLDFKDGKMGEALQKLLEWRVEDVAAIAKELDPQDGLLHRAAVLVHTDAAMRLRLGQPHVTAAHFDVARNLLLRVEPASDFRRDWLLAVGYRLRDLSDALTAFQFFMECESAFPRVAQAWLATGTVYEFSAFPDDLGGTRLPGDAPLLAREAEKHYRAALSIDPSMPEARLRLGRVLQRSGREQEALQELERLDSASNDAAANALGHLFRGDLFEQAGRIEDAAAQYRSALSSDPSLQQAGLALSRILWRDGQHELAVEALARALHDGCSVGPSLWFRYHFGLAVENQEALEKLRRRVSS